MATLLGKRFPKAKTQKLQSVTLSGMGGGWNAVDDDISMQSRFLKTVTNTFRTPSGGQHVRYGTSWFTDIANVHNSPIVDMYYYNGRIVNVCSDGWIVTTDAVGTNTVIWNPTIAASRVGAPSIWTPATTQVSFASFKDKIAIHNGKDKPLQIDSTFTVNYLQDAGSGSNVNTPIGKFGCVAGNYHCIAGITGFPTVIYISSQGTIGTYPGDPAPNDAISIDVGAYAPEGGAAIRGIAGYRSFLIVFLQGITIQVKLGIYTGTTHTPSFPDTFPKFGLVGSRCITVIENDIVFAGIGGLSSAKRNIFSGNLDSDYLSSTIDPEYRRIIGGLTDTQQQVNTFGVFDPLSNSYMIINPNGEYVVYTSNEKLHFKAWSKFTGWNWACGCTSFLGRVFFANGTKIFRYGNATFGEIVTADKVMDRDATWAPATVFAAGQIVYDAVGLQCYTCNVSHTSTAGGTFAGDRAAFMPYWTLYTGISITFELEQPWFSGREAMQLKHLKYLSLSTKGSGEFTVEAWVDNLFKDENGSWITDANGAAIKPQLSMTFVGNDARGEGVDVGPFGGGRRSRDPRLYKFPVKFKMIKFRITGSTTRLLEFINMSFLFARGKYTR